MGFTAQTGISAAAVFLQGLLSFFSPCVLPLLPLYIGYLSGGAAAAEETPARRRGRVMLNTFFFVLGISAAFFLLGLGMTAVGRFLGTRSVLFARIGGVIVILFGLYQLGVFGQSRLLGTDRRLPLRIDRMVMSPVTALIMGFAFSFAWTPCVGPALSGVLLMAASAASQGTGLLLIGVYTLGFVIPFLAVGMFTNTLLDLFRKHAGVVKYTVKVGGVLLVLMGVLMLTGAMSTLSGYFARLTTQTAEVPAATETAAPEPTAAPTPEPTPEPEDEEAEEREVWPAYDFTLYDQYGTLHTLSDYRGKVVFLNFWATWCPYCLEEMPDIEALYEQYALEGRDDVVILGAAFPGLNGETDTQGVAAYLEENGYLYPTLMDTEGELLSEFYLGGYPTTYMIDADGNIYGYVTGMIPREFMEQIIEETLGASNLPTE